MINEENLKSLSSDELQSLLVAGDEALVRAVEFEFQRRIGNRQCPECGEGVWECPDAFESFVAFSE